MPIDSKRFRHEYDLDALERIRPVSHQFEMLVTPRYRQHYSKSSYESFTAVLVRAMSRSHDLFLDIGAHYGFFSLIAGTSNPDIEVLASEPVPESHEVLVRNFALNGIDRARVDRRAVSDRVGTAAFNISLSSDNCSFYPHPVAPPIRQVQVETVPVDALLAERRPCRTLLKMDTDGHEISVLRGMEETLHRFPDIKLFVELNPKMQRLAGHQPEDLLAELDRLGFEMYLLDEDRHRPLRLRHPGEWSQLMENPDSYVNLYCCPRASSLSVAFFAHSAQMTGAQRSLLELVTELVADHGTMCTVVLPEKGPMESLLTEAGAGVVSTKYSWWCASSDNLEAASHRDFTSWLGPSARTLLDRPSRELERVNPHALVTHTIAIPWGALLAPILGKPHAWHLCEYGRADFGFQYPIPFDAVVDTIRESSHVVFTAVEGIRELLFPAEQALRSRTLYRHVEITAPKTDAPPLELFRRIGSVKLGQFATYARVKGQDLVVQAVAQVVRKGWDVELVLAGEEHAAFREELSALIRTLDLEDVVRLTGFVEDGHEGIRQTDLVVIGSRMEAFGRVAVEAMLLGKPVVYPRVGGFAEYMRDGETGLGYPPGDAGAMAAAIETLVADSELREEMGQAGRRYARSTFTKERYGGVAVKELRGLRGADPKTTPRWLQLLATLVVEAGDEAQLWRDRHDRKARDLEQTAAEARLWRDRHDRLVGKKKELTTRISAAERRIRSLERQLSRTGTDLNRAKRARDAIRRSSTWRLALRLRKPLDALAPAGSRRRALVRRVFGHLAKNVDR